MLNRETLDFIKKYKDGDVRMLAMKSGGHSGVDLHMALMQIEGWQIARKKLPAWAAYDNILFPPRLSLEQCSSEEAALYKKYLVERIFTSAGRAYTCMVDLTGGYGIDFSYIAPLFEGAVYVERQDILCRLAAHNFPVLGLENVQIVCGDGKDVLSHIKNISLCFVDPARRDSQGRKTVSISDCEPDLTLLQKQLEGKAEVCLFKLSPLLDISRAVDELSHVAEIHVVSVRDECKELLLVIDKCSTNSPVCRCVNLQRDQSEFIFTYEEERNASCDYVENPESYLYEPNASIMKAGAFKIVASRFGLKKLHPNSHLYTSDKKIDKFPGRVFAVEGFSGFSKSDLKALLKTLPNANLTIRNFPSEVSALRKKLKLKDGGDTYLFATTVANGSHILIRTHKAESVS